MPNPFNTLPIGARIRTLRNNAHLTQSEMAKEVGVSRGTLGKWECGGKKKGEGKHKPSHLALDALLGVGYLV